MINQQTKPGSILFTGLLIVIILGALFLISFQEPTFFQQQTTEHLIEPLVIITGNDAQLPESSKEQLEKLAAILLEHGFRGKEIRIAVGDLPIEGIDETIKPTSQLPLTYLEIQRISKRLIREHIQKPNSFIEEGFSRFVASQVLNLDPHRFARAVLEAQTLRKLEEVIFFESDRSFTPRSRFQAESVVDYLISNGYVVKDLLGYTNRFLSREITSPLENSWSTYLRSLPHTVGISDLRYLLVKWDEAFAYVARTLRMIYPTAVSPLNAHYRALLHYLETIDRPNFDQERANIETISARLPKLREVRSVWDAPSYWDFASFWLISMAICLFSFLLIKKIKLNEHKIWILFAGVVIAQTLTFFKLHLGLSQSMGISLFLVYLFYLFFLLTDSGIHSVKTKISPISSFLFPVIAIGLLFLSLRVSGMPFYEPSLLGFALFAYFFLSQKEPKDLGLTIGGFNFLVVIIVLLLGLYYYLPINYSWLFVSPSQYILLLMFSLAWVTLNFGLFYHLLRPYLPENLLFFLLPVIGMLAEIILQKPLLYSEVAGFWLVISLLFMLTKNLPLIWGLTIARSTVLIQFKPEDSPYLFLPMFSLLLLILLYVVVKNSLLRRRLLTK